MIINPIQNKEPGQKAVNTEERITVSGFGSSAKIAQQKEGRVINNGRANELQSRSTDRSATNGKFV